VATRGNAALALTRPRGADGADGEGWCVHVPLSPAKERLVQRSFEVLAELRRRNPALAVPEPLFQGELGGLPIACARRLPGLSGPQLSGDTAAFGRTLAQAARDFATLVVEPPAPLDARGFDELLGGRFVLVSRHAADARVVASLAGLESRARERLAGRLLPRVFMHGDLRSKHLQVAADGRVLGYLDWGTSEPRGVPGFDLLHLLIQERKQAAGIGAGEAWRRAIAPGSLSGDERAALDEYSGRAGLEPGTLELLAELYPVLVGAVAEATWDYSRPRWIARQFQL
jgi:hypothetical protein